MGEDLAIVFTENGNYSLVVTVQGNLVMNRTWQATIVVNKFLDISNTVLVAVVGMLITIPALLAGSELFKKMKGIKHN